MKMLLKSLLFLCFCLPISVYGQWTDQGATMRTYDGVSIGSTSQAYSLYVRKDDSSWQGRFANRHGAGSDVYLAHGGGYGMHIRGWTTGNQYTLQLYNKDVQTNVFYNSGRVGLGLAGNVGIGTSAPGYKLDVHSDGTTLARFMQTKTSGADGSLVIRGSRSDCSTCNIAYIDLQDFDVNEGASGSAFTMARVSAGMASNSGKNGYLRFFTSESGSLQERMRITQQGKVRIGNVSTASNNYSLFVEKGILAQEVKVAIPNTGNWSDYVFEQDYDMLSIDEMAEFVQKNKHLPKVPSAEDMVKNGLDVATMDAKLLEKIEELHLYIIQLNDKIKALENK